MRNKDLPLRILFFAGLLFPVLLYGHTLSDYGYSTGVDNGKWITLSATATQILDPESGDYGASSVTNLGFTFPFGEESFTQFSVNTDGNLKLGSVVTGTNDYSNPLGATNSAANAPKINFFGCDGYATSNHYVRYQYTVDANNDSVGVVEFCMGTYTSSTRNELYKWQVHLYSSGKIVVVYGPSPTTGPGTSWQRGMCVDPSDGFVIDGDNLQVLFPTGYNTYMNSGDWPASGRYYQFIRPVYTCFKPLAVQVTNIGMNSFNVGWTDTSSATQWHLLVLAEGVPVTDRVVTSQPVTVTGLVPSTNYQVKVAAVCGVGDTSAYRSRILTTPCAAMTTIPYHYGFEDAPSSYSTSTTFVDCWMRLNNGVSYYGYPYVSNYTSYNHTPSGSKGLYWYNYSTSSPAYGEYQCVVLPGVDTSLYPLNTLLLRFWVYSSSTSHPPVFQVGVMTDPNDITSFMVVRTVNLTTTYEWTELEVDLSDYTGDGIYLAVKAVRASGTWTAYVDDFSIVFRPQCPQVVSLEVDHVAPTSAMATWDVRYASDHLVNYTVEVEEQGVGLVQTFTTTDAYAMLTALSPITNYLVRVRANCTGVSTDWDSTTFVTICSNDNGPHITGNGSVTTTYRMPINNYYNYSYTQQLVLASEMSGPATLLGIRFNYASSNGVNNKNNCTIYVAHTSLSSLSTSSYVAPSTMTMVYTGPLNVVTGWNEFLFTTPFAYNGTSNLVVAIDDNSGSYPGSSYTYSAYNTYSPMSLLFYSDSDNPDPASLSSYGGSTQLLTYRADMEFVLPCDTTVHCFAPNLMLQSSENDWARIVWAPGSGETSWDVDYRTSGGSWVNVATGITVPYYTFTGLATGTEYDFRVSSVCEGATYSAMVSHRTRCSYSTFSYDNLHAPYVHCYYGTYSTPDISEGVVDYGYISESSRHTVHYDTTETDLRTRGLHTVPEGYCSSVRLGNWSTGSQAERIVYTYAVDTNDSDLLLLKYAAVLEDPNHNATEQPRFTFRITDQMGNTISPCYAADFIANANLGWNSGYSQVLWKDWTTVGVDLTSMHGQTIQIELTSYDCNQGGHYGYAYFVLDLSHKALRSNSCSGVENTFYAPAGFNYSWYEEGHEGTVLSTVDSLSVSHEGVYHCQLSFVGAPLDEEHSNCYFTMSAVSGVRYPYARFSVVQLDTSACSQTWMRMLNSSIITSDSLHTDSIGNGCESYLWSFDDGTTSTEPNPRHGFTPGQHSVTLYAMLADGACGDSATQTFLVLSPCMEYDTVAATICEGDTLWMFDTALVEEGTHVLQNTFANDSILIRTVYLTVNPRTYDTVAAAACVSYAWALDNQTYTATGLYNDTIMNHEGCDSVVTLNLRISPNYEVELYDTLCEGATLVFGGHQFATTGRYTDSLLTLTAPHCDSVVYLNLTVHANTLGDTFAQACESFVWHNRHYAASVLDTLYGFMPNAVGCDSSLVLHLSVNNVSVTQVWDTCTQNQLPRTFRGHTLYGPTTSLSDTISNATGCDSIIIYHLWVLYNSQATMDSTVCETQLPLVWYHRTFTAAGTQADTLANSVGADSILQLTLHVVPTDSIDIYRSICDNQSFVFEGTTYTAAGTYPHQFLSSQGCDSVRTLHLTLLLTTQGDTMATECDQFLWHGTTYTTDDTVTVPAYTTNLAGCDSAVTLYLRILPSYHISVYDTICSNTSYLFEGAYYSAAGSYNVPLHTATLPQCDSIRTLYLAVRDTSVGDTFATACDQYWWYGRSYTLTTLDQLAGHYTNAVGCDSAVNLHLTVNHSSQTQVFDTCVENVLPRYFNGITIGGDTTGVQVVLADGNGCDSTVTYQLHVWHNDAETVDSTICDDALASFVWHGTRPSLQPLPDTLADKAVMHDTIVALLSTTHGADSTVTLLLHVHPTYRMTVYDTICNNDTVLFGGAAFTTAGQYNHTFATLMGCDSVVTLHLTVNPTYAFHFYDTVYYGDTVSFEGNDYNMPGHYQVHYATTDGCDSVFYLHLTGRNVHQVELTDSICAGDTLYFVGRALTEEGVYVDTVFTGDFVAGDTIVTLNLVVLPRPTASVEERFFCETPAHYQLQGHSNAPYLEWLGPAIAEGHEHDSIISLPNAKDTIHYILYVDYRPEPLCPETVDVTLAPIEELNALIDLRPSSLTVDQRHLTASHAGGGHVDRQLWYVFYNDESPFTDTARRLNLDVPMYVDSMMIVLNIENDMCAATDTVHVDVLRAEILFPNVFTPSLESNMYFKAYSTAVSDFELWIYDRRGDLVFHTTDIDEGWDGTSDGRPLPQATYVYKCHYRDQITPNGWQSKTGTVTLLR
ncbi:MAG: fibronectin type III domain-containing protein [Bacteroidales bacterium]|nr:fibronectin type III domain-containing protein [Bacteroidales bacterium]